MVVAVAEACPCTTCRCHSKGISSSHLSPIRAAIRMRATVAVVGTGVRRVGLTLAMVVIRMIVAVTVGRRRRAMMRMSGIRRTVIRGITTRRESMEGGRRFRLLRMRLRIWIPLGIRGGDHRAPRRGCASFWVALFFDCDGLPQIGYEALHSGRRIEGRCATTSTTTNDTTIPISFDDMTLRRRQ